MTVVVKDRGYKKAVATIAKFATPGDTLTVGVHGDEGEGYGGGVSVLDVATWNEFGTDTIPARSFIRAWADENESSNVQLAAQMIRAAIKSGASKAVVFGRLGIALVGQIQARISAGIEPDNAPATIARKGSSTPLIHTGQLRQSIKAKFNGRPVG